MLEALQSSAFAQAIAQSQTLTAALSAVHVVGFVAVMSGAMMFGMRATTALFGDRAAIEVLRPAARLLFLGLSVSVVTGALLFAPRARSAAANSFFEAKMGLLVAALTVQVFAMRRTTARASDRPNTGPGVVVGAAGLLLWLSVAIAACAFILIE